MESLLSSHNRAITMQRMAHWQTRAESEINESDGSLAEAKASEDSTFPKRVDSPWKVGAHVSAAKAMKNTVINAVSIGSVMHR